MGEGSTQRGGWAVSAGKSGLPLGVAVGVGARLASREGLIFCFLGVVGSVLGADPEAIRFTPLGMLLGKAGGAWGGG